MIDLKHLKSEFQKYPDPLKSVLELSKDTMGNEEFVDFFISFRKKAREIDIKNREVAQK